MIDAAIMLAYVAPVTDLARGAYEHLITRRLDERLLPVAHDLVDRQPLDPADSEVVLSRHIAGLPTGR